MVWNSSSVLTMTAGSAKRTIGGKKDVKQSKVAIGRVPVPLIPAVNLAALPSPYKTILPDLLFFP